MGNPPARQRADVPELVRARRPLLGRVKAGNALQAYAKARGLTVVFDVSKMQGVVMVVDGSIDITSAFSPEVALHERLHLRSIHAATPKSSKES